MQGKYKTKKCSKGVKKIKKYNEGTSKLLTEDGSLTQGAGLGLGVAGTLAAGALENTGKDYDVRYTSQLKDENQAVGRGIGAAAGQGLNLLVPGLGTVATPLLSSAGGAIQRAFQGNKLKKLKQEGEYQDRVAKANENVTTDLTSFQAKQYSKGTKVIEIEGKKTPEIHTDKNFNLKNLGTTPHSKGGDKVVAEEGDVVFPTQNSPKKYNEIMNAIMKKDKYKLKKEQSKLPEDKVKKYDGGTKRVNKEDAYSESLGDIGSGLSTFGGIVRNAFTPSNYNAGYNEAKVGLPSKSTAKVNPFSLAPPAPVSTYAPLKEKKLNDGGWLPGGIGASKAEVKAKLKAKGGKSNWKNPNAPMTLAQTPDNLSKISGPIGEAPILPTKIETAKVETPTTPDKQKKGLGFDGNNLMELAPIAYNLGQGLFGKAEKVNRKEYQPELEEYVDTSNNMRREVNQAYRGALSNARNLSGGLASNVRANSQAAANQKLSQMNQIDSQEYGKQLDVNNRNVDRTNEGRKVNIDLFNNYEDLDAQNRAVKQNALTTGLEQLGELGSRNKLMKNSLAAQKDSVNLLTGGTNYRTTVDDNGQTSGVNFNSGTGASYSNNLFPPLGLNKKKVAKQSKGNKSIQVERKYKLK